VSEQQLDLLQLAASGPPELCASASQIMGRDSGDTDRGGILLEHLPDDLFAKALAGYGAGAIYRAEGVPGGDAGGRCPGVNCHLDPRRHRRGANAAVFSHEIDDAPASIALLDMGGRECRHLRPAQPAAEKDSEDGTIAQTADSRDVGRAQQRLACR